MPRRHDAARERVSPEELRVPGIAPAWAQVEGFTVREVLNDHTYLCPGCNGTIPPGVQHLAVAEDYDPEGRRHWHASCWRQEARRIG